jgi:hypothetical protein
MVYDPLEARLPRAGRLVASDGERRLAFNSSSDRLQRDYITDFETRLAWLQGLSRKQAIPLLPVSTAAPVADQVRRLLGQRERVRRI